MTDENENAKKENTNDPQDWRAQAAEGEEVIDPSFYETLEIELLPGGRVRMDSQQDPFVVEMQLHPVTRRRRQRSWAQWRIPGGADVTEMTLLARDWESIGITDIPLLHAYLLGLSYYLDSLDSGNPWLRLPGRSLPQQGKRTDPAFYRDLLALSEQLKLRGSMRPAAEIAERLEVNPNTVRTWLMRARKIREEQR
jgi:hypothetical protein